MSRPARKRVEAILKRSGNDFITLDESTVRYYWKLLNRAVFRNKLPLPARIEFINHPQYYAWTFGCDDGSYNLTLFPTFVSLTLFLHVLVHEMVHVETGIRTGTMDHDTDFFKWKQRIKHTVNMPLEVDYSEHQYSNKRRISHRNSL